MNPRQQALINALTTPPYPTLTQAARNCDIPVPTAKRWNAKDTTFKAALTAAMGERQADARRTAESVIREMVPAALKAKATNLKAKSEHVRHLESSWVLERLLGKTPDRIQHEGKDGGPIQREIELIARLERIWDRDLPPRDVPDDA
jgi:hypothetical protein